MRTPFNFPRYTYNDYKNWKEDWELIDGYPLQMLPSASFIHNKTIIELIVQAGNCLKKNEDCKCKISSELDWKINDETVVRPDLMVICGEVKSDFLEFSPVLIVEVISPSSIKRDRVIKFDLYREQGVKFYILIDYIKQTIEVFELIDNFYKEVNRSKFPLDKTCEVEFDFEAIWK